MDRNKNSYIFIYSIILVVVVAGALSLVAVLLQPKQAKNYEIEQKRNILSALKINVETKEVESNYAKIVTEIAVDEFGNEVEKEDALILYKAQTDKGLKYVFPLSGKGLWGPIWGYISLDEDLNTVYGAYFDHKSETSGLGAEIATEHFQSQFSGKKIFNSENQFVAVKTNKRGAQNENEVDAISGATITSTSVSEMLESCLNKYLPYIEKSRK
ncbi:MAG: NADH:ubiquinone reductase (Na(+)-transporting) subunit C [Bacteroidales bacterium]|nr:NADH:ubiquinone reductase (Na(+)-transporting) subunit C [Bacteroidales bacterium]